MHLSVRARCGQCSDALQRWAPDAGDSGVAVVVVAVCHSTGLESSSPHGSQGQSQRLCFHFRSSAVTLAHPLFRAPAYRRVWLSGRAPKPLLFGIAHALGEAFYSFPKCFSMLASGQWLPAAAECVRVENIREREWPRLGKALVGMLRTFRSREPTTSGSSLLPSDTVPMAV